MLVLCSCSGGKQIAGQEAQWERRSCPHCRPWCPRPRSSGPHALQMHRQDDQTDKDWPWWPHPVLFPVPNGWGDLIPDSLDRDSCVHLPGLQGRLQCPACQAWERGGGKGHVWALGRRAHPGGSNEACQGHRGCLGVAGSGRAGRGGPGVTAVAATVISLALAVAGVSKHAPSHPAIITLICSLPLAGCQGSLPPSPPFHPPSTPHICATAGLRDSGFSAGPAPSASPGGVGSAEGVAREEVLLAGGEDLRVPGLVLGPLSLTLRPTDGPRVWVGDSGGWGLSLTPRDDPGPVSLTLHPRTLHLHNGTAVQLRLSFSSHLDPVCEGVFPGAPVCVGVQQRTLYC